MDYEIVATAWWSSLSEHIGAVLIHTLNGYKAYLGTVQTGVSEGIDSQIIAQNGAKVTYEQAKGIFTNEFKHHKITRKKFIL